MTHSGGKPHDNIGDRGQRFEVRCTGYPNANENHAVAWTSSFERASEMACGLIQAPGAVHTAVIDRQAEGAILLQIEKTISRSPDEPGIN